ncbi:MAG: hypothetical protein ACQEW9_08155 [Bacteroidota bacterium]|uniref:PH domain-containing protein n=1 Tax=Algoriphagus faecimaris TaxID=686796 RepID=A0A1G6SID0_9BACT|nr:hypothetical protein [Algoriphagus faecimaris]SDD16553.1 hypothetical protein SAMN04488104_101732 [Algoriphagus faecimaris]
MVVIKPKGSTYFSLGLIVIALLAGLVFILRDFAYTGSFGLWFYLVAASIITLVLLMLLVKMLAGFRFITAGRDQIIVKLPLRGYQKAYPIADILVWEEEVILANKKEFRQLTVAFSDQQSISVSNHEHEAYSDLVKYLRKKAAKKEVKNKKA